MKFLIAGYYGLKNLGDELILSKIIEDIKRIDAQAEIIVSSGNLEYTRRLHNVSAVNRFSPDELMEAVRSADVIIVGGGGLINEYYSLNIAEVFTSFGYCMASYAIVPLFAKYFQKPVFYWSHGVGPIFSEEGRNFTKWFYTLSDFTTLRDAHSYSILRKICPEMRNVYVDTDPVMVLDVNKYIKPLDFVVPDAKIKIGINIRPWFGIENIIQKFADAFSELCGENNNFIVVPIPFDLSLDKDPLRKIITSLPERFVFQYGFEECDTPEEVISLMNHVDFFIGTRLHAIMVSRLLKIPTLTLSYDLKTDTFADILKTPTIRVEELTKNNLVVHIKSLINSDRLNASDLPDYKTPDFFKNFIESNYPYYSPEIEIDNKSSEVSELLSYGNFIKSLRAEIKEMNIRYEALMGRLNETIAEKEAEKEVLSRQLNQTIAEKEALSSQLNQTITEKEGQLSQVRNELANIYASDFWRVASWYYKIRDTNPILRILYRVAKKYKHKIFKEKLSVASKTLDENCCNDLQDFILKNKGKDIYIVYAGVRYTDTEGQRSVRLSQSFVRLGKAVIFVYFHWSEHDKEMCKEEEERLFVIARDDFLANCGWLLNKISRQSIFFITYPDTAVIPVLLEATSLGITTVYDILDNWEEFSKAGIAPWYDQSSEFFILRNVTYRFAVNNLIGDKFSEYEIHFLPNGFSPEKLRNKAPLDLQKGEITIGYFGYLSEARFDWNLFIETAKNNPLFIFHIIGYGMPDGLKLPQNVLYFGKVHPHDLSSYVSNWDVCTVPFKNTNLSKYLDPLKIYEYLYFRKPVVVTGVPHIGGFPYVLYIQNDSSLFANALRSAKEMKIEDEVIADFLKDKTWTERAKSMLHLISKEDG